MRGDENVEKVSVQLAVAGLVFQDVERRISRYCALVRAVLRGEGVVDVGDRHHLRLQRDLLGRQPARITRTVELLVVPISDLGNATHDRGPRNLAQEMEAV